MVANNHYPDKLLKSRSLAITSIRRQVLLLLAESGRSLSRKEIEKELGNKPDRVTIYRTLKVLCDNQLIHKVIMETNEPRYKLIEQDKMNDDHPHFFCLNCHRLLCLSNGLINTENIPEGYMVHSTQVVIEGICRHCNRKSKKR